jgi:hypothetical protein
MVTGAVVVLAANFLLAGAAPGAPKSGSGGVTPAAVGCAVTFTNPGPPALTVCVSGHGNINDIVYRAFGSPVDHVSLEGYCLLNFDNSTAYYDAGDVEARWGVATLSSTATTVTIKRTTTDGVFTLTQNIFFKYGSRMVLVGNLVKNNDAAARFVFFNRSFDGDIEGTAGDDVYDTAGSSVYGRDFNALALTSLGTPTNVAGIGAEPRGSWVTSRTTCLPSFESVPTAAGDHTGTIQHQASIPAGATVNFRVGYRFL